MKFILKRRVESSPVPLLVNLLSLWETVWLFSQAWSKGKTRGLAFLDLWYLSRTGVFSEKFRMILIRLRAKKMGSGLYSLRFIRSDLGSLVVWKGTGGAVSFDLC